MNKVHIEKTKRYEMEKLSPKRFCSMLEPRTAECMRECGKTLPCHCHPSYPEHICDICPIHPPPILNIKALKALSGADVIIAKSRLKVSQ